MNAGPPAGHLDRLKLAFPGWTIWHGAQTGELWAAPPPGHPLRELISAPAPDALEAKLTAAERRRDL